MEEQPVVNNPIQQPNIPTPQEPKHHSFLTSKLFLITLTIAVLFTAVYAGIYIYLGAQLDQIRNSNPTPTIPPSASPVQNGDRANWKTYTYSSIESGILPSMTFKYPSLFGNNPTLVSSRNTNPPVNISEDWGGFFEFNPTGAFGDRGLRIEFFKRVNSESSFESYVSKSATNGGWDSPKYFQAGSYKVARLRFSSSSHYDADVSWYFVELSNKSILAISTSGDKKFLYDDDQNGKSTRDQILSTFKFTD